MTAYERGMRLERRVAASLEADGYQTIGAKGSKGVADLWASKPGQLLLVQVKVSRRLDPAEWDSLVVLAEVTGGLAIFVHRAGRTLQWWRLTGRKTPRKWAPCEPWHADEVNA